jgi:hypothetical protein
VTLSAPRDPDVVAHRDSPTSARQSGLAADAVAVLGVYVALGVLTAVVWWLLYDPALYTKGPDGGLGMGEVELGKRFDSDAWYAVVAAVAGLLSGTLVTWWRGRDPLLTALLVLVGALVAAGLMSTLGGWLGPPDPRSVVASVEVGGTVPSPLRVDAAACYLVWPVTALIGSLIVLWSPPPADEV